MNYKSKKRGFTLVEVIVTITILGVVTLVALPVITSLKSQFDISKFKVYQSSLESAGKLFVDSNLEDVFGNEENGCTEISYTSLVEKRLLEDISIDGVTCFNGQTYVRTRKTGSKIEYETSLYCTQNGNEVYSSVLDSADSCENEMGQGPTITISSSKSLDKVYKTNSATIILKDSSGLSENQKLKYKWIKDSVDGTIEGEKELNISFARGKVEHKIPVDTPSGQTGNYYLVVTPIDVKDVNGNQTTQVVSKGPFKLDNTAPDIVVKAYYYDGTNKKGDVLTEKKNSNISFTTWSTDGYYFDFSGSSDGFSSISSEKWEWNPTGKMTLDKTLTGSSTANSVKNHTISAAGIRYAKYTVADQAGNERSINITVYIAPVYYISYAKNNGTGTISNTKCYYSKDCALTTSKYTRTGYKFNKWKINDDLYSSGATVKNLTTTNGATITATAQWTPISYTLKYNGNGATSGSANDVSCKYDTSYTLVAASTFTKTGYHISGFKIGNNTYAGGASVKNLTTTDGEVVTATAQWSINKYTIKYDGNGSTSGSVSNTSCTYNADCTLANNGFSKTGYTFGGWKINSTNYTAGQKVKNLSTANGATLTATAIWNANKYTIKYDGNGSTGGSVSNTSCTYGSNCTLANNGFSKTGYKFTKWKIGSKEYSAGEAVKNLSATNGATLTASAQWSKLTYTVSYNNNGGSGAPGNQTKTYGTDLTLSSTKPTRSGWTFEGWGTSASDTSVDYASGAKYTKNANITLYAIWSKKFTATFYRNKAGWSSDQTKSCTIYNAQTSCTVTSPKIGRLNKNNQNGLKYDDFLSYKGWATTKDATSKSLGESASLTLTKDVKYYSVILFAKTNKKYLVKTASGNGLRMRKKPVNGDLMGTMHDDSHFLITTDNTKWAYGNSDNPVWVFGKMSDGVCSEKLNNVYYKDCSGGWSSIHYIK